MRRRQATQRVVFGDEDDDESLSEQLLDEDGVRGSTRKARQKGRQMRRQQLVRAASLGCGLTLLVAWANVLPPPLQANRMVRNATVRFLSLSSSSSSSPPTSLGSSIRSSLLTSSILFANPVSMEHSLLIPDLSQNDILHNVGRPKYNDLVIKPLSDNAISRAINAYDMLIYTTEREKLLNDIDEDPESERVMKYEDYAPVNRKCRRNNWRDKQFPNCLTFHETSVLDRPMTHTDDFDITYTGHGYFRDSWMYQAGDHKFILKKLRMIKAFDFDEDYMYQIHREAIVMERLTASPSIVDIYGFCATSIMSEPMLHEVTNDIVLGSREDSYAGYMNQTELDLLQMGDVRPMNNLTVEQKLDMAIAMAESIAEIHGFEGGVIVHGDIHPYQWLSDEKGQVKLNDFNNGEILDFNVEKQEYCKLYRCFGGTYRSPEEFRCIDSNEGMDTYSMGNNLYTLLTGLWPFYQYDPDDSSFVQDLLIHNKEKPFIDPRYRNRSVIEAGLVKAMEKAWEWDLDKRESIFEMVQQLHALRDIVTKQFSSH